MWIKLNIFLDLRNLESVEEYYKEFNPVIDIKIIQILKDRLKFYEKP